MKKETLPALQELRLKHYLYEGFTAAWLVVHDPMAGRRNVYTVYQLSLIGTKGPSVIGRELDLPLARKIVRQAMARGT